jgi:redox-sensitive bicupin YhaK (pirin superfamily)
MTTTTTSSSHPNPTLRVRRADDRGRTLTGWLNSRHSFSFNMYYDPAHMGFRSLRVINEDLVAPGGGFGTHGHNDMEIVSIALKGAMTHRDSLGHTETLNPGDIQVMTAGTGIRHSEFNASQTQPVRFMQIWIEPESEGLAPSYQQKLFDPAGRTGKLQRIAGRAGLEKDGALPIHQDADVYLADIPAGRTLAYAPMPGRGVWVQLLSGALSVNGQSLAAGDGLSAEGTAALDLAATGTKVASVVLFDLK